jgi:hypothetical protein
MSEGDLPVLPESIHDAALKLVVYINKRMEQEATDRQILMELVAEFTAWFIRTHPQIANPTERTKEESSGEQVAEVIAKAVKESSTYYG